MDYRKKIWSYYFILINTKYWSRVLIVKLGLLSRHQRQFCELTVPFNVNVASSEDITFLNKN